MRLLTVVILIGICTIRIQATSYEGVAYEKGSGTVAYRETYNSFKGEDGSMGATVEYSLPSNVVLAEKKIDYSKSRLAPAFEILHHEIGLREGIRYENDEIVMYRHPKGSVAPELKRIKVSDQLVVDAGFHFFILQNWDHLRSGNPSRLSFALPNKLAVYPLIATYKGRDAVKGKETEKFVVQLDNFLLKWIMPPITLHYTLTDKRLVHFSGVSNILFSNGKKQVNLVFNHGL